MFLARLNGVGGKIFVESNAQEVALNLARIDDGENLKLEYWHILDDANLLLETVTLKSGTRAKGVVTEVVEIEAGTVIVGSAERET